MAGATTRSGWDDVIVGAGSAGSVLASRLSACPDRQVLLLEAGADSTAPAGASTSLGTPVLTGQNWDYSAHLGSDTDADGGRECPYRVGKVVGGSSAVNGAIALRGLPADFDGWAEAGNPEWAWQRVLPYFSKLETDADMTGAWHGSTGPIPIRRPAADELDPVATAFLRVCRTRGMPHLADLNAGPQVGVGLVPSNAVGRRRMSTAETYLAPVRNRSNLTVWTDCRATRVLAKDRRVVGVEMLRRDRLEQVSADRVTVCAGAVNTPGVLQRSGLGDANRLATLGIRPLADLPGVGQNLVDHAAVAIWAVPKPGACREGAAWHQVMARVASGGGTPDLNMFLANNVATSGLPGIGGMLGGRMAASVSAMLLSPESRGTVQLPDASPDGKPVILLRLAATPGDVERLMRGARLAWSLIRSSPVAELLGRALLWTERMIDDDDMLARAVRRFASPMFHPAGTARMGPACDELAVVDQHCQVRTVSGLRVVDASVMPSIPSAPTNLACIMLAERVAEWMN
jgi:choline dehydrogenase